MTNKGSVLKTCQGVNFTTLPYYFIKSGIRKNQEFLIFKLLMKKE